jgi:hypothetical protein
MKLLAGLRARLVDDINCAWRWLTTWLNVIGTAALTYALTLDPVVTALLPFLPGPLKPYAPIIGPLWGAMVQIARSYKQKPKAPANG